MKLRTVRKILQFAKAQSYLEKLEKSKAYFEDHNELGEKKTTEKPEEK